MYCTILFIVKDNGVLEYLETPMYCTILFIVKDNGVLEYLETPMRNCAYSAPPTPRNRKLVAYMFVLGCGVFFLFSISLGIR